MWEAVKQALILVGDLLKRKPSQEDDDGTPSMRDVAIAQESGATASREGKLTGKTSRAPSRSTTR